MNKQAIFLIGIIVGFFVWNAQGAQQARADSPVSIAGLDPKKVEFELLRKHGYAPAFTYPGDPEATGRLRDKVITPRIKPSSPIPVDEYGRELSPKKNARANGDKLPFNMRLLNDFFSVTDESMASWYVSATEEEQKKDAQAIAMETASDETQNSKQQEQMPEYIECDGKKFEAYFNDKGTLCYRFAKQ